MKRRAIIVGENLCHIGDVAKDELKKEFNVIESSNENEIVENIKLGNVEMVFLCLCSNYNVNCKLYNKILLGLVGEDGEIYPKHFYAIGNKEDCDHFQTYSLIKDVKFFYLPYDDSMLINDVHDVINIEKSLYSNGEDIMENIENSNYLEKTTPSELIIKNDSKDMSRHQDEFNETSRKDLHAKKDILLVDDDLKILKIYSDYLKDRYSVSVAKSGEDAMKYLKKNEPDLILLDYMMPGENGSQVYKEIREKTNCTDTPIVFVTSVSDKDVVRDILSLKPQGYILKPIQKYELLDRIDAFF